MGRSKIEATQSANVQKVRVTIDGSGILYGFSSRSERWMRTVLGLFTRDLHYQDPSASCPIDSDMVRGGSLPENVHAAENGTLVNESSSHFHSSTRAWRGERPLLVPGNLVPSIFRFFVLNGFLGTICRYVR